MNVQSDPASLVRFPFGKVRHPESGRVFEVIAQIDLTVYRPIVGAAKVFSTMLSLETTSGLTVVPDPHPADIKFIEESGSWRVAPFEPEPAYFVREFPDDLRCERIN